jgi:hypothetical protein
MLRGYQVANNRAVLKEIDAYLKEMNHTFRDKKQALLFMSAHHGAAGHSVRRHLWHVSMPFEARGFIIGTVNARCRFTYLSAP